MSCKILALAVLAGLAAATAVVAAEPGRRHGWHEPGLGPQRGDQRIERNRPQIFRLERRDRFPRGSAWRPPRIEEYRRTPGGGLRLRPDRHQYD